MLMLAPGMGLYSPRQHAYQFWNGLKVNFLYKVKYNIFESGGTKPFKLILQIYFCIPCAIINNITCMLYHKKARKHTFLTVYIIYL